MPFAVRVRDFMAHTVQRMIGLIFLRIESGIRGAKIDYCVMLF